MTSSFRNFTPRCEKNNVGVKTGYDVIHKGVKSNAYGVNGHAGSYIYDDIKSIN